MVLTMKPWGDEAKPASTLPTSGVNERKVTRYGRQNRQIVGHGIAFEIIRLRAGRIIVGNADTLDAVQSN